MRGETVSDKISSWGAAASLALLLMVFNALSQNAVPATWGHWAPSLLLVAPLGAGLLYGVLRDIGKTLAAPDEVLLRLAVRTATVCFPVQAALLLYGLSQHFSAAGIVETIVALALEWVLRTAGLLSGLFLARYRAARP